MNVPIVPSPVPHRGMSLKLCSRIDCVSIWAGHLISVDLCFLISEQEIVTPALMGISGALGEVSGTGF